MEPISFAKCWFKDVCREGYVFDSSAPRKIGGGGAYAIPVSEISQKWSTLLYVMIIDTLLSTDEDSIMQ